MNQALQDIVRQQVEALGLELFELRVAGSKNRPVVDVRIEKPDGQKVTVEDCARVSRAIETQLDAGGIVNERYRLEVSSPGIERPLRNARDWSRFAGERASVSSDVLGGSRELVIRGIEGESGNETVILEDARGELLRVPLAGISKARLAFHWNR